MKLPLTLEKKSRFLSRVLQLCIIIVHLSYSEFAYLLQELFEVHLGSASRPTMCRERNFAVSIVVRAKRF